MPSGITIQIQMRAFIKDFLVKKFGPEPIVATRYNFVGVVLDGLLQKPPAEFIPRRQPGTALEVELVYKPRCRVNTHFYLPPDSAITFNKACSELFWSIFFDYMDNRMADKVRPCQINDAIDMFAVRYGIEPAGHHEMLKKAYYRYRKCTTKSGIFDHKL